MRCSGQILPQPNLPTQKQIGSLRLRPSSVAGRGACRCWRAAHHGHGVATARENRYAPRSLAAGLSLYSLRCAPGKGSFGAVYRGVHVHTGEEVAVKIINLEDACAPSGSFRL